jgi:glycosyltransferase involved in cell wall biosynthesis
MNILFITEATLTGAPILLCEILKEVSTRTDINITILVKQDDVLVPELNKYGKVFVLKGKAYQNRNPSFVEKLVRATGTLFRKIMIYPKLKGTDVIISNTITNGNILKELSFLGAEIICYVHELENLMRVWRVQSEITNSFRYSRLYMVPSMVVKENLITNHGVPESNITLFKTYLSVNANQDAIQKQVARRKFCERYHLDPNNLLVVGMGVAQERKGTDLFVEIAHLCKSQNIHFTWIGDFESKATKDVVDEKIKEYDLGDKIVFTGPLPRSYTNLLPFDLFFLSSREDPYPLVVLEAASLGIPCACFAGSGGIVDFVSGNGWIINDFSVKEMAEKMVYLNENRSELAEAGDRSRKKFIMLHNNRRLLMEQFDEIIKTALN